MNALFLPKIYEFDTLESTNETLKNLYASKKLSEGTVVVAKSQSAGKGQRGKSWESESGQNLLFTILLLPKNLAFLYQINMMIALSVKETVEFFLPQNSMVKIKWPNDILVDGEKISGILIENKISGNSLEACFIGVGLNVNQSQFLAHPRKATSLQIKGGKTIEINRVMEVLLDNISANYLLLKSNPQQVIKNYLKFLYLKHSLSNYTYMGENKQLTIIGVNEIGQLCLQDKNGEEIIANQGELEFYIN